MAEGGASLTAGQNVLAFGPSGTGKSHLTAAIAKALVDAAWRVSFWRTIDLIQPLQHARRDLALTSLLEKLDKFDLLVLDDFSYVRTDQAEGSANLCGRDPNPLELLCAQRTTWIATEDHGKIWRPFDRNFINQAQNPPYNHVLTTNPVHSFLANNFRSPACPALFS